MGNESSRDTEHTERGCEQLLPHLALDQEMIRSSLRKRGLLVAERDLNDALDRHSNPVEAISFLIESGRARRAADVQRRSTIRVVKNDRRCPPTESALSTTRERSLGKRARRDSEVSVPGEATLKRRIHNQDPETLVLSENANDCGLREISTKACAPMLAIECDSTGGTGSKAMKAESVEMEKHVVTPMKPGLDSFPGNKTESPRRTFSPKAAADEPTVRPLVKSPKLLHLGNLQNAMLSGTKGWSSKTPEEKKEAVRVVKDNLCLVDVGAQRKDQLDDQLTRCICVALTDLADAPDINAGISLIGDIIQATRSSIHGVIIETGVLYSELFSEGKSSGRASNAGVHRVASKWRYTTSMKSPSPADKCNSRPFDTSGAWRAFDQVDHLERGGLFSSNRLSSFLEQPRAIQSSRDCGRTTALPFEARKGTASRVGSGAAGLPKAPEEEVYWVASGVCKETLRKARVARSEVEWVANQAGDVNKAVDRTKAALRKDLQRQEEKVEKVEGDVQRLSEELEQLTRGLIEEHVASNQTKEEALLSFLDTLKGVDGAGDRKVKNRARAIALHEAARSSCRKASAERLLVSHAVKIGEVLCHELFGDLFDILSDMEVRASQRRLKCQSDLKSTAKHMLDKLEAAVGSLMYRRRIAAKKREERIHTAMESRMLFGHATANGAADQALINEMECFMEEASTRAEEIKADAKEMWSRMQEDLSKEDVLGIAEDAKQFFSGEADVTKGEVAESSPGESVCEASQQTIIAKAKIDTQGL